MSRWICIDDICIPSDENDWEELVAFADAIAEQEPIDIVCCGECKKLRDCRHDSWQTGVINMGFIGWCKKTSRLGAVTYVKADDFCSYGERESE